MLAHQAFAGFMSLNPLFHPLANDLVCNEETKFLCKKIGLKKEEVIDTEKLLSQSDFKIDYSLFNPKESDIWKNRKPIKISNPRLIEDHKKVKFREVSPVGSGMFRFLIEDKKGQQYRFIIGRKSHNILLRRALLRKLGYIVPDSSHVKKVSVEFKNSVAWRTFLKNMSYGVGTSNLSRWVTNIDKKSLEDHPDKTKWVIRKEASYEKNTLILQDVIVTTSWDQLYDLSIVFISSVMKNRRVFNSLLIPYALVDVPESFNKFNWNMGKQTNEQIFFKSDFLKDFRMGYEDGKWIAKKILDLERKDFEDIVKEAALPQPVSLLAIEKLISRRNSLCLIFFPNKQSCIMEIDFKKTDPQHPHLLKNGRLLLDTKNGDPKDSDHWWEGYGSRFSYGPDEAPLSRKEMTAFFTSQIFSNLISNFVSDINKDFLPNSDNSIQRKAYKEYTEDYQNQIIERIMEGKEPKNRITSLKNWSKDILYVRLNASRDIIFGGYLGTSHNIQLVHSFGWAVDAGWFLGSHGGPRDLSLSGRSGLAYSENYTQVTPSISIKEANKTPYKNIFVHFMMKKVSEKLNKVNDLKKKKEMDFQNNPQSTKKIKEEEEKLRNELSEILNEHLKVGESFIITRNIGPFAALNAILSISPHTKLSLNLRNQITELERVHILRKDQNTVHIYSSNATRFNWGFTLQLRKWIPIFTYKNRKARSVLKPVNVKFLSLNILPDIKKNPEFEQNSIVLKNFFSEPLSTENISDFIDAKDYVELSSHFTESFKDFKFLWQSSSTLEQNNIIKVKEYKNKEPFQKKFIWASSGKRTGVNYQSVFLDILNHIIEENLGLEDINVGLTNTNRPSETIFGHSTVQQSFYEGVIEEETQNVKEAFVNVSYRWKGWALSKEKLEALIRKLNSFQKSLQVKTNLPPLPISSFSLTNQLQLYSIFYNIYIYEKGIQNIANWGKPLDSHKLDKKNYEKRRSENLYKLFEMYGGFHNVNCDHTESFSMGGDCYLYAKRRLIDAFKKAQDLYQKTIKTSQYKKIARTTLNMTLALEPINFDGLINAIGGSTHIYTKTGAFGYREGDEGNHKPIFGNSKGKLPEQKNLGPIQHTRNRLGISEGELYLYWLLRRL